MSRAAFVVQSCVFALTLVVSANASAHVAIDAPLPDSSLITGQIAHITWIDLILHEGVGYDLDFVPSGDPDDRALPIAHALSVDTHSFDWLVPATPCDGCYIKVTQLNVGQNYSDAIRISLVSSLPDPPPSPPDPPAAAGAPNGPASSNGAAGTTNSSLDGGAAAFAGAGESSSGHHFGTSLAGAFSALGGAGGLSEPGQPPDAVAASGKSGRASSSGAPSANADDPVDDAAGVTGDSESEPHRNARVGATAPSEVAPAGGCELGGRRRSRAAPLAALLCLGLFGVRRRRPLSTRARRAR